MENSNLYDDLSVTNVQEKAAPVGNSLRVAVTKTSAQGRTAQSTAPNLMSFSTDENSIWFNKKKYGVYILKEFEKLSNTSATSVIQSFLGDFTHDKWVGAASTGNIVFVRANNVLTPASVSATSSEDLNITFVTPTHDYSVKIHYSTSGEYSISLLQQNILVRATDVNNTLTTNSTTKPLSAAMGKKLQDDKLSKADASNTYLTRADAASTYAKKTDGISYYSIGELTVLSSSSTQDQLKAALGTPNVFRDAIDKGKLILVKGNANAQSQKSATCIIDSGSVIVKYLYPGNNDWTVIAKCVPASSGDTWDNTKFSVRIVKPLTSAGIIIE